MQGLLSFKDLQTHTQYFWYSILFENHCYTAFIDIGIALLHHQNLLFFM